MDTSRVSPSRIRFLASAALLVVLASCGARAPNYVYKDEPDPRNQEWVIGVGDRLGINVWENEALTTESTVRPDGTITMPLVGDLKAAGLTPTQLKQQIKTRLADFVKQSEITVAVLEVQSYRFTIAGEVQRPGVYSSAYYVTILEALALAGNFTRFADSDNITLHRRDPKTGQIRKIPFVYGILAKGNRPDMNIVVLPGDSIFVP
jgi:polysaccharide export outer membrane protein